MRVQISGKLSYSNSWSAFGQFRDLMAADTGELSLLGGQGIDSANVRSMTLVFPGRLEAGSFALTRYVYGAVPTLQPAAYVIMDSSFFASIPGGTLTVTSAAYPPRPGLDPGLLSGTLDFHAVRLVQGLSGPIETTDTIVVHVAFAAHWYHYLRPNVTVTLSGGGPLVGSSLHTIGQSVDDDHGGRFVEWESDFDLAIGPSFPYEISQEFRIAVPATGTYTLGSLTPAIHADAAQWPATFSALYYRDDPRIALSTGGTLTVTTFVAPTDAYYGEIRGTIDAPLALWTNDSTVSADTVRVQAQFAVQLWPLGGIPASRRVPLP